MGEKDAEALRPERISWMRMIFDQGVVTQDIIDYPYKGSGTAEDPYIVEWIVDDPRNPMLFPSWKKWSFTQVVAFATLAVSFVSSAYSGGVVQIIDEFGSSEEVTTLGISLFVLGFAVGPLLWAPLSELYGRQILYSFTYAMLTFFNAGACGSQNIYTLIILRFFAGAFGSSPLTNAGGVIADMFPAAERGLALTLFASAPFLGPTVGPVIGGFVGETIGWRWLEGIMAIFTGVLWIIGTLALPETYPPVLLRRRAERLTKLSGGEKIYKSKTDAEQGTVTLSHAFKTSLSRPWILLFREPIVLLLSIYMAIIYGTLYMLFGAYPIVFQDVRGWSQGIGGLPFLGVAVGMIIAIFYALWDNKRYMRICDADEAGYAPPEARLPPCCVGGIAIPIGLFWFAWTNYPDFPFMACVSAGMPFGFGMVLVFLAIMNYLIDAYTIFAASVLAANTVLRSTFGAVFPLFTNYMYSGLGIHWASSVPAFLALACVPFPFLFYKYGGSIRERCKYAAQAKEFMEKTRGGNYEGNVEVADDSSSETLEDDEKQGGDLEKKESNASDKARKRRARLQKEEEAEQEAFDYSYDDQTVHRLSVSSDRRFSPIRTATKKEGGTLKTVKSRASSMRSAATATSGGYEMNPYDIDRVNTRESFRGEARPGLNSRPSTSGRSGKSNA